MTDDAISERDGPTLEEMNPRVKPMPLFGDWCYRVVLETSDGQLARPNIQAPDEEDCRRRIEGLYAYATILSITAVHRARSKLHRKPAVPLFPQQPDARPVERRIAVRRRPVPA